MSIDSMINEPMHILVHRCIYRRKKLKEAQECNAPEPILSIGKRLVADANAALRVKLNCDSKTDLLEEYIIMTLIAQGKERRKGNNHVGNKN